MNRGYCEKCGSSNITNATVEIFKPGQKNSGLFCLDCKEFTELLNPVKKALQENWDPFFLEKQVLVKNNPMEDVELRGDELGAIQEAMALLTRVVSVKRIEVYTSKEGVEKISKILKEQKEETETIDTQYFNVVNLGTIEFKEI